MSDTPHSRIAAAYDPAFLEAAGHRLAELLGRHLRTVESREGPVLNWSDPETLIQAVRQTLPTEASEASLQRFSDLVQTALANGQNLHHPRYVGHQVPASVPIAGLFDAIGSVTNNPMAVFEMGPWSTAVEHALIRELGRSLGWDGRDFGGVITHGGSLANLTALLVARNVALPESWTQGVDVSRKPALVVQADAHYCIARSAGVLGLGTDHIVKAPLDARRRMDPEQLDGILADLRRAGRPIVAVVACACATPIGAFDPLDAIADICEKHDVWLHVDAAHGGAVLLSEKYKHLVAGLDRADSLVWDAHKMLFVPALCAFIFYKHRPHAYEAFRQNAPYLFDPAAPGLAEYDSALKTVECTKRAAAFGLWGVWSLFGPQLFADMVDVTFDLTRTFHDKLRATEDFEPLHAPECNILAFRHIPARLRTAPVEILNDFQRKLRWAVIQSGRFYLVQTALEGQAALRVTIINPLTTADDLDGLIDTLRAFGAQLQPGERWA